MTITLQIQSQLGQVRLVRAALCGVLDHLRVSESDIFALELAVAEVVNNCLEHGYGGVDNERVTIRIQVDGSEVVVDVIDQAPEFPPDQRYRILSEPLSMPEPDDEWSSRGHGLQIVRQIVDSIAIRRSAAENILTFSKNVSLRRD